MLSTFLMPAKAQAPAILIEDTVSYKTKIDYVYQHVDRSYVTTGLLSDYGVYLTNIDKFNGVPSDTNYMDLNVLKMLYLSLFTCKFNPLNPLQNIQDPEVVFNLIDTLAIQNITSILLTGFHHNYDRLKLRALVDNLVYVDAGQIYDTPGRASSPFEVKEAFSFVPTRTSLVGGSQLFLFKPELFWSNTNKTISQLQVDFDNGVGYRTVAPNTPITVYYSADGVKTIWMKLSYTDGTFKVSRSKISVTGVEEVAAAQGPTGTNVQEFHFPLIGFQSPKPWPAVGGKVAGAKVTVECTNLDNVIRKPLIIVEGFDAWHILHPDDPSFNHDYKYFIDKGLSQRIDFIHNGILYTTLSDALGGEDYDIIFIDFDDGTNYIQRNAYLVENVIQWVNSVKETYKNGVTQPNVVLDASMGGLVARYALRDMELNGVIHDTRLYCSFDSPHQGANIPVGLQYMVSHLYGQKTNLPGLNKTIGSLSKELKKQYSALNSPAARQMMLYSIVGSGTGTILDNTIHTEFMSEYSAMGYPNGQHNGDKYLDVRNLVIANGSECATNQGFSPGALFASDVSSPVNLEDWMLQIAQILSPSPSHQVFVGALINPALSHVRQEISVWALPNQTGAPVYFGKWRIFKKMPWLIPDISVQLFSRIYNAPTSLFPADNAAGGTQEFNERGDSKINFVIPRFCFIPTFSSLDIGGGLQPFTSASLTTTFSPSSPPVSPNNVFANNFVAAPPVADAQGFGRANEPHVQVTKRNGRWLFQEITGTSAFFSCAYACNIIPAVSGPSVVSLSGSVFSSNISNASKYTWTVPLGWKINGQLVTTLTLTTGGASVTIQPPSIVCGSVGNPICVKVGDCEIQACASATVVACTNDALKFDGSNDFVNIPEKNGRMNLGTGNFVMEAFIKSTASGSIRSLLSKRTFVSGSTSDGFFFGIMTDGRPFLQLKGAPNIQPPVNSANLYDGSCHHVAVRRSGTTLSFFVDGNFIGNGDATSSRDISSTGAIRVAGDLITTSAYNGWIGEVRVWNATLTNAQILSNVPLTIPIQTALRGYFDMKDLLGSQTLTDLSTTVSTTKNNGTLGSATGNDTADPIWLNQNQITCNVQGNFRMAPLSVDNSFLPDTLKTKPDKSQSIVSDQNENMDGILHVFPNPFDIELKITNHTAEGTYRLRVLNSTGQVLVNEANQISGKEYSVGGAWTNGLYIVIIEDRQRRFLKVIKK